MNLSGKNQSTAIELAKGMRVGRYMVLAACNGQVTSNETIAVTEQAVTQPSVHQIALQFLPGTDIMSTALLAAGTLRIADNVKIVESSNASTYAPLEKTGSVSTEVGAGAKVGGLPSVALVPATPA